MINKLTSNPNTLKYDIPQGTVLNPMLLFICLCLNELLEIDIMKI